MHLHVDDSRCRLCSVLTLCLVARSEASAEAPKAMRNPEFQIFDFVHSKCKMADSQHNHLPSGESTDDEEVTKMLVTTSTFSQENDTIIFLNSTLLSAQIVQTATLHN